MDKRELDLAKIKEIFIDLEKGVPIKKIARLTKTSKNTIKNYRDILNEIKIKKGNNLSSEEIYKEYILIRNEKHYSDNFGWLEKKKDYVEELVTNCDNYVRLLEVITEMGFKGSYSSLQRYLKNNIQNSENPIVRIETKPGEDAQVDFGYVGKIFDDITGKPVKAYVFVMTLGFSRHAYYEIVTSQDIETWCNCHINAFEFFGGVPKIIIPDNLKSAIIKATFLDPIINKSYGDLAKHYGFQVDPCIPRTPQHKGKVESGVKYVKNNFIPLRVFTGIKDANKQLMNWTNDTASIRIHGTTQRQPIELFKKHELKKLGSLNVNRFEIPIYKKLKVYKDIHIQLSKAYYSVPYEYMNKYVLARKTKSQVTIFYENAIICTHKPIKLGRRATNYDHYPADKTKYMKEDTDYCIVEAKKVGTYTAKIISNLLIEEPIRNLGSSPE